MPSIEEVLAPEHLTRIRAGDERAFEAFFRAWYPRLADYALRMLESRDTAEDVVQNLFVALWNRRDRWPDGGKRCEYHHRVQRRNGLHDVEFIDGAHERQKIHDCRADGRNQYQKDAECTNHA